MSEAPPPAWQFVDHGPRSRAVTLWRRVCLWCGIVGRTNWTGARTGAALAWTLAATVWPWNEHIRKWERVQ